MNSNVKNVLKTIAVLVTVSLVTFMVSAYVFAFKTGEQVVETQRDIAVKLDPNASFDKMGPEAKQAAETINSIIAEEQFHADPANEKVDSIVQFDSGKDMADYVRDQREEASEAAATEPQPDE